VKSILEILPLDKAITHIAQMLHEHAGAEEWGTQQAVARWLETLACDLDDCARAVREGEET
jgi:hypothetical protein